MPGRFRLSDALQHPPTPFRMPKRKSPQVPLWSEKTKRVLFTPETAPVFAKWAPERGLFNRRFGVHDQDETDL